MKFSKKRSYIVTKAMTKCHLLEKVLPLGGIPELYPEDFEECNIGALLDVTLDQLWSNAWQAAADYHIKYDREHRASNCYEADNACVTILQELLWFRRGRKMRADEVLQIVRKICACLSEDKPVPFLKKMGVSEQSYYNPSLYIVLDYMSMITE